MATKIKFSFIKIFFRLFSFLADKTGGWKVFVQPKLMLGTMILGFGVAACNSSGKAKNNDNEVLCYEPVADTVQTEVIDFDSLEVPPPCYMCYDSLNGNVVTDVIVTTTTITTKTSSCYIVIDDVYPNRTQTDTIKTDTNKIEKTIAENDTTIYTVVDKKAEFPGGNDALWKFINDNIQFPMQLVESGIQGKVFCRFVIEKTGEITNIEVIRSPHKLLDKEAVRVIEIMPKWIPAEKDNKIVRSYFILPVSFILRQ